MGGRRLPGRRLLAGVSVLLVLLVVLAGLAAAHGPSRSGAITTGSAPLDGEENQTTHPSPFTWSNGEVSLTFAGETPTFYVSSSTINRTNISVGVRGLAEVTPVGSIDAIAPFSQEGIGWNLTWTNTSTGVQVNLTGAVPVGAASGNWSSSEWPEEEGGSLGAVPIRLTFHLTDRGNASSQWAVKFDLGVHGWPWVSRSDSLGLVLVSHAVGATSFEHGSDDGVGEYANATGSLVATLSWGPSAQVTYANGKSANATVLSNSSFASDDSETQVRLLFAGAAGGYSSLFYDPTVTVNPSALFARPPSAALPIWMGSTGALIGLAVGVGVVGSLVWIAYRGGAANPRHRVLRASKRAPALREGPPTLDHATGSDPS